MWRHYIYTHSKKDTGEVFYVGKGTFRKNRKPSYERATAEHKNNFWINVVRKHGYTVDIFASCKTDKMAQQIEKKLIAKYKRRDTCGGLLVNLTDGGDGHCGIIVSDELRAKRSENSKGKRPEKWVAAIRKARKNGGNGGVVKKGDKLPKEWIENIRKTKFGKRNPMYGKTGASHPLSKPVINIDTNETYESISEAAEKCNYDMKTLHYRLCRATKNTTNLRLL